MGRKAKLTELQFTEMRQNVKDGVFTVTQVCERSGVSVPTYYNYLRRLTKQSTEVTDGSNSESEPGTSIGNQSQGS